MNLLPAEWAAQSGIQITWPHTATDWAPLLLQIEAIFVALARVVVSYENLIIACHDEKVRAHVKQLLATAGVAATRLRLCIAPSNDTWARDHAPITVMDNGQPLLLDFQFNGWGRKYAYNLDNALSLHLHAQGAFGTTPLKSVDLVLEGGSIESDGYGTILTTSRCLLSPQRNPRYDCVGLEGVFAKQFGSNRVLWLDTGKLIGDDTDGHIDTLARFCDPHTIVYAACDDPDDEHYTELQSMASELAAFHDYQGKPYKLVPLPLPTAKYDDTGQRLPATYTNFLIINGAVLVPTYHDLADPLALERLSACFPEREIIAIDALPLIQQSGSLHCLAMQFPAAVP